jgi:hypothetical protein
MAISFYFAHGGILTELGVTLEPPMAASVLTVIKA